MPDATKLLSAFLELRNRNFIEHFEDVTQK